MGEHALDGELGRLLKIIRGGHRHVVDAFDDPGVLLGNGATKCAPRECHQRILDPDVHFGLKSLGSLAQIVPLFSVAFGKLFGSRAKSLLHVRERGQFALFLVQQFAELLLFDEGEEVLDRLPLGELDLLLDGTQTGAVFVAQRNVDHLLGASALAVADERGIDAPPFLRLLDAEVAGAAIEMGMGVLALGKGDLLG